MKTARFTQSQSSLVQPELRTGRKLRRIHLSLALLTAVLAVTVACGGSSDGSGLNNNEFVQVIASDTIYTLADLEGIEYKVSKTYDVEGLVDATDAYYGFWRDSANSAPVDYEVRIYASHTQAVESGTAQAEEATGDDAVLDRSISSWPEGINDRRRVVGPGASQASGQPRYLDYVILGNLVILCEGRNLEDARDQCGEIVSALQ